MYWGKDRREVGEGTGKRELACGRNVIYKRRINKIRKRKQNSVSQSTLNKCNYHIFQGSCDHELSIYPNGFLKVLCFKSLLGSL